AHDVVYCHLGREQSGGNRRIVEQKGDLLLRAHGELIGDRVAGDLEADGIDQDQPFDPVRIEYGEFRGDPPTEREADDRNLVDTELVLQRAVEKSDVFGRFDGIDNW